MGHGTSRCPWLSSSGLCGLPVQILDAGGSVGGRSPSPRCLQGPDLREAGGRAREVTPEQRLEGGRSLRCEGVGASVTISGHVAAVVPASPSVL